MPRMLFVALRAVLIASFLAAAAWRLGALGLQYDEAQFVNAALGGIDDTFVHHRILGVPVMIMAWIGALKSWLHAPIFALLGVSPATIRLPSVLLCGASLYFYSALAETLFGRQLAVALLAVLATDPALFFASRFDHGPIVLMIFFKSLALVGFFAWLRRPTAWRLAGTIAALALGVYDKLNFLWFVLGLILAAALIFPRATCSAVRRSGRAGWIVLTSTAGLSAYVGISIVLPLLRSEPPGAPHGQPPLAHAVTLLLLARDSLEGGALWSLVLNAPPPSSWLSTLGVAAALLVLFPALAISGGWSSGDGPESRPRVVGFFALLFATILAQILATPQTYGAHHAMMLFPFHVFALFAVVAYALDRLGPRRLGMGIALALLAGVIGSQVAMIAAYLERLDDPAAVAPWADPTIFVLSDALLGHRAGTVVSVDWGLHTQLFSLAPAEDRPRFVDLWSQLNERHPLTAAQRDWIFERGFARGDAVVVLHPPEETFMPDARAAYLALEQKLLRQTAPPQTIRNAVGRALYEIRFVAPR